MFLSKNKFWLLAILGFLVLLAGSGFFLWFFSSAPQSSAEEERFILSLDFEKNALFEKLETEGFVKKARVLQIIFWLKGQSFAGVELGGYHLAKSLSAWKIAETLLEEPYMKWVTIPEGYRKEQSAELFAEKLGWETAEIRHFIEKDTQMTLDEQEGVYFPDTYLISVEEDASVVAERLRTKFNEVFAPYLKETLKQNIRWPTLLKIASIVQREAAGIEDMPLIAGVLWNRLLNDQKLEVDATVQYARDTMMNYEVFNDNGEVVYLGEVGKKYAWWQPIKPEDKNISSPFNTYRSVGLPPRPIANPGEEAIKAVLFPEETDCFFYLHDSDGVIHCSKTYAEHQENIEKFLR